MSLIDEALKRARQEAARQEAAEREARYARVPVFVPPPRRSRPWLLPVVVSVCLAAGVAGGVVISHRSSSHSQAGPLPLAPSPVRPPAPAPNGRGGTPATVAETPVVERAEEPVVKEESPEPPAARQAPAPTPAPVQESAVELPPSPPPPSPAPPSPAIALPQAPAAEPLSYVREVPAPGGGTVRLNGIAFSGQPVALFGDKVVAPGESVNGFTVVAIEAQRVKLQGPGGTMVYVTLK